MRTPAISVVGMGYVGLSTAVCLSHAGISVIGVEVDLEKLASIERGKIPFQEKGLDRMLDSSLTKGTFQVSSYYDQAVRDTSITFLTVGTPSRRDGSIDLSYLKSASTAVGKELAKTDKRHSIVVKSTAIPGTTEGLVRESLESSSGKKCGEGFGLAANPEFLREGSAVQDTLHPDAIVIGAVDAHSKAALLSLYRGFYSKLPPVISTTPANAELIKYAVNTFRATQLSFLNTIANVSQGVAGADVDEVAKGLSAITKADPRYLKAGLGYGGSCLPKDLRALIAHARQAGSNPELLEAALHMNETQPEVAIKMARDLVGELSGKRVAVLGLAFKAGTDDVRESVAIKLVEGLLLQGATVTVYDPAAMDNARKILNRSVEYARTDKECLTGADCAIVATNWEQFAKLRPGDLKKIMRTPAVVDGRRLLDAGRLQAAGIKLKTIGTGSQS